MMEQDTQRLAQSIAIEQGELANSPAEMNSDGKLRLCLASCYAAAGLELSGGREMRASFERDLAASSDKRLVESVYRRLGWDVVECQRKMKFNDQTERSDRIRKAFQQ